MNERIRELWIKAAESTAAFPSGQNNSWETQVNFLDKFAELIVRECMNVAVYKSDGMMFTADIAGHRAAGREIAAKMIKEHFGVEE